MSYAARDARRFVLALMVAGLGILVTACNSATAPETDVAAQLRTDTSVDDDAGRQTPRVGGDAGSHADQRPRYKYGAEE